MPKMPATSIVASTLLTIITSTSPGYGQDSKAPPLVNQINNGNWLSQSEAEAMRDELYYQRAVQVYMSMLPALNTIGMRDGSEAMFGKGYNVLPIWKQRMDARTWVPTPNADVIYSMSYLDLKETGPLVVAAPPNVIGMFTDFFQRTLTDVGAVGPDRARGGLYLLLPWIMRAKFRRATSRSSRRPTTCSCSSAPLWRRVTTGRIRNPQ
ncbi:hypothetical protein ABIF63_006327 [Bradyrhizobium japonicum]|uniref:DUF1254 domain-containing protein n=1 Tax=Bradyrhizobium japonicum TaxID=375 RepID=A0ABV2RZ53_BRAJP